MKKAKSVWVRLGVVGVDSGQLMVCDPCYIGSEWKGDDFKVKRQVRVKATGKIVDAPMGTDGRTWDDEFTKGLTWNQAIAKGIIEHVELEQTGEFSYDGCCHATIDGYGGQLNFTMGHAGAGVVFTSGLGDGRYEVLAKIVDLPDYGERVSEVRIKLITKKEIQVMDTLTGKSRH